MERTIVATLSAPVPEDDRDWQERRAMTMTMMTPGSRLATG